jgi:hypothetical protein
MLVKQVKLAALVPVSTYKLVYFIAAVAALNAHPATHVALVSAKTHKQTLSIVENVVTSALTMPLVPMGNVFVHPVI